MMKMTKDEIRRKQKKLRNGLSQKEWEYLCDAMGNRLFQTQAYQKSENIFSFVSFQSEADTKKIILRALLDGKKVFVPRVEAKRMDFYEIHALDGLIISSYGISEPPAIEENKYQGIQAGNRYQNPEEHSYANEYFKYKNLMLLPGLAFDPKGNRIGYGAGYYDRYLTAFPESHFYKIAIAFDFQLMEQIESDEYDRKADAILTPTRLLICN